MAERQTIKIDDKEYFIDELSNEAKAQIQNILYVNNKVSDLQSQIKVLNAAKEYYLSLLRNLLPQQEKKEEEEKIKFN